MRTTYLLAVAGKSIGREHGLRPIPVHLDGEPADARDALEAVMVATVRRCMPLAPAPQVEWTNSKCRTAHVYCGTALAAKFTVRQATDADMRVGTTLPRTYR